MKYPEVTAEKETYLSYRREGYGKWEAFNLLTVPISYSTMYRWERWFQMEQSGKYSGQGAVAVPKTDDSLAEWISSILLSS